LPLPFTTHLIGCWQLGSVALTGALNPSVALPLYAAGVCWTIVYDTIYAHQDTADDAQIGVKSTALLFGTKNSTPILSAWAAGSLAWYVTRPRAHFDNY
jgi:4-hydroxybenzoate polyprenyltransferase